MATDIVLEESFISIVSVDGNGTLNGGVLQAGDVTATGVVTTKSLVVQDSVSFSGIDVSGQLTCKQLTASQSVQTNSISPASGLLSVSGALAAQNGIVANTISPASTGGTVTINADLETKGSLSTGALTCSGQASLTTMSVGEITSASGNSVKVAGELNAPFFTGNVLNTATGIHQNLSVSWVTPWGTDRTITFSDAKLICRPGAEGGLGLQIEPSGIYVKQFPAAVAPTGNPLDLPITAPGLELISTVKNLMTTVAELQSELATIKAGR